MIYETRLNEEKRNINILREEYLQEFLDDMRQIMTYDNSSEFIDQTNNTSRKFKYKITIKKKGGRLTSCIIILLRVSQSTIMHHPRLCLPLR